MSVTEGKSGGNDAARIAEVKAWLTSQLDAAEIEVPDFQYTPRSIAHLFNSATVSQAKTQAASIVANDFRQKAVEHRPQGLVIGFYCLSTSDVDHFMAVAARMREMLENVGLAQESLPSNVVSSAQVLAFVANLLNIRDTELSRWAVILAAELHFCSCLFDVRIQKWRNANSFLVATGDILLQVLFCNRCKSQIFQSIFSGVFIVKNLEIRKENTGRLATRETVFNSVVKELSLLFE